MCVGSRLNDLIFFFLIVSKIRNIFLIFHVYITTFKEELIFLRQQTTVNKCGRRDSTVSEFAKNVFEPYQFPSKRLIHNTAMFRVHGRQSTTYPGVVPLVIIIYNTLTFEMFGIGL